MTRCSRRSPTATAKPTTPRKRRAGAWTRDIPGIGGELTATQTNTTQPVLQLHDLQGNIIAEASISETATALLKTYNSTEYGVPSKKGAPPKYAWLGAEGLSSELPSGTITQDGTTYVPQTGRPLQTEQAELPEPIHYINPYVKEDPGTEWDAISSAKQVAAYWETRHAQETAADPPGAVPAPTCDAEPIWCGPDPHGGENIDGCRIGAEIRPVAGEAIVTYEGQYTCSYVNVLELQIQLLEQQPNGHFAAVGGSFLKKEYHNAFDDSTNAADPLKAIFSCTQGGHFAAGYGGAIGTACMGQRFGGLRQIH